MRPLTMLGVGAVTALLLAACSSDGDELSEEEFLAQANEICQVGNDEIDQLFDEAFDGATEENIAQFIEEEGQELIDSLASNVRGQIADIRDLSGPSDLEDEVDPVLDEASEFADGIADSDPEEFLLTEDNPFAELNPQLDAVGLTTCAETGE